jgi:arylsulfatase A-like enzyme
MFVPMILAGPGVPVGRVEEARTVDLMPTLLHLLGRQEPPGLDGRVLPLIDRKSQPAPDVPAAPK